MSKNKKKNQNFQAGPVLENTAEANNSDLIVAEAEANKKNADVASKTNKPENKKAIKKDKKEKKDSKIKRMFKETGSELKKVTWPTFGQTVKKTGVVLGVVVFFSVILFAIDFVLSIALRLLAGQTATAAEKWVAIGIVGLLVIIAIVWLVIWSVRKKNRR